LKDRSPRSIQILERSIPSIRPKTYRIDPEDLFKNLRDLSPVSVTKLAGSILRIHPNT
jgi:hypothetical protein